LGEDIKKKPKQVVPRKKMRIDSDEEDYVEGSDRPKKRATTTRRTKSPPAQKNKKKKTEGKE